MSKISNKKAECGYEDKPLNKMCSNCAHFKSTKSERLGVFGGVYTDESEKRCGLHGFAVKKMARCGDWEAKAEEVPA